MNKRLLTSTLTTVSAFFAFPFAAYAGSPTLPQRPQPNQPQRPNTPITRPTNVNLDNRNEAESDSSSISETRNESSINNLQINNTNNVYSFRPGMEAPVSTLSGSVYYNGNGYGNNDYGAVITFTVPIGGKTGNRHARLQEAVVANERLVYASQLATVCANLAANNVTINNVEGLVGSEDLAKCGQFVTINNVGQVPVAPVDVTLPPVEQLPIPTPVQTGTEVRGMW